MAKASRRKPQASSSRKAAAGRAARATPASSHERLLEVVDEICAASSAGALKKLRNRLDEISIDDIDAATLTKIVHQLNARMMTFDVASDESFELQCIRDAITSS